MIHSVTWLVGGSSPLKGDLFVIVGSILYAASNVSEVWIVFFLLFFFFLNLFQSTFLAVLYFMWLVCSMECDYFVLWKGMCLMRPLYHTINFYFKITFFFPINLIIFIFLKSYHTSAFLFSFSPFLDVYIYILEILPILWPFFSHFLHPMMSHALFYLLCVSFLSFNSHLFNLFFFFFSSLLSHHLFVLLLIILSWLWDC